MRVSGLRERLNEMGVAGDIYAINSVEYPNEAYSIFWNGSEWEVYYSERGQKRGIKKFFDESEACEYFLKQIGMSSACQINAESVPSSLTFPLASTCLLEMDGL